MDKQINDRLLFKKLTLIVSILLYPLFLPAKPVFSKQHGVYNRSFILSISSENRDVQIRYTLDGSEPSSKSPLYESSIMISETTVIRAAEFNNTERCSDISSVSYIFPSSVVTQNNTPESYPKFWGKYIELDGYAIADYEMDPEMMSNRQMRNKVINSFSTLPILSMVTEKGNLFNSENNASTGGIYIYTGSPVGNAIGKGWERPVSIELFGGERKYDLTVDCAIQIHGGHSRLPDKNPKHSFRITFKSDYGPSKLFYPIYGDSNISEFNSLIVRTFFGDSWTIQENYNYKGQYIRDQWMRMMQKKMGYPFSDGIFVHAFINGLYWGIYNLSERIDDRYCKYHFGDKRKNYDIVKMDGYIQASEGNLDKWNELCLLSSKATQISNYNRIVGANDNEALLDVDNFIDYMILNFYVGNVDWDHHNWFAIRNRETPKKGFQFISWDGETIFYDVNTNILNCRNNYCPTAIFHNLMENNTFKHRFIERAYQLLSKDGLLTEKNVVSLWDSLYYEISDALYAESARWGDYRRDVHPYYVKGELFTVDQHYTNERDRLLTTYFPERTDILIQQLLDKGWYTKTLPPVYMVNNSDDIQNDTLYMNDVLSFGNKGKIYYTIDGKDPVSWAISSKGTLSETAKEYVYGTNILNEIEHEGWVKIRSISQTVNGWSPTIEKDFYIKWGNGITETRNSVKDNNMYDLNGRKVTFPTSGIYIQNGKKILLK